MAARIGFTRRELQRMDPSACDSDARFVMKNGDAYNTAILYADGRLENVSLSGTRELRLLAKQMLAIADHLDRGEEPDPFEVVLP